MAYDEKQKQYSLDYAKKNIKRVPLDMQKSDYEKLVEAAAAAGMKVNRFIKEAIAEKIEREEDVVKKKKARALGWAYGRLERALSDENDEYDRTGAKYAEACSRPLYGFVKIHAAAIREHKISASLQKKLAEVLSFIDLDDIGEPGTEPVQPIPLQSVWQLAHIRGKSGQDFLAE